jgi:hypothetical protein
MSGGMIMCLAPGCPDPGTVTAILSDPETEHVAEVTEDGWTLKHPLRERAGDGLFACRAGEVMHQAEEDGALVPGRWRLLPGRDGATAAFQAVPPDGDAAP